MTNKLAICTLLALLAVVPASAVSFLTLSQSGNTPGVFTLVNNGTSVTLQSGPVPINYTILVPNGLGTTLRTTGFLAISATSTTAATGADPYTQGGFNSGVLFICDTLAPGGCSPGSYVFAAVFGPDAQVSGASGGAGAFGDAVTSSLSEITFFSPYLAFTPNVGDNFSLSFSGGPPNFSIGALGMLNSESAGALVGTFAATQAPSGAPEPATMALLGSALIGLGIIGRKRFSR